MIITENTQKALFAFGENLKSIFIRIFPMSSRFNQDGVRYVYIYGVFFLIHCDWMVFATFTLCLDHILSIFRV